MLGNDSSLINVICQNLWLFKIALNLLYNISSAISLCKIALKGRVFAGLLMSRILYFQSTVCHCFVNTNIHKLTKILKLKFETTFHIFYNQNPSKNEGFRF